MQDIYSNIHFGVQQSECHKILNNNSWSICPMVNDPEVPENESIHVSK